MSRLVTVIALAAAICVAYGQSTISVPVIATTPVVPAATTTAMVMPTSTPTTQPTTPPTTEPTTEPPTAPTDNTYLLNNSDGSACLVMKAGIAIHFNYSTGPKTARDLLIDFTGKARKTPDSTCDSAAKKATLKLEFTPEGKNPYYLTLDFEGEKGKWNVSEMEVQFKYARADFPDYTGQDPKNGDDVSSFSNDGLFGAYDVNLNQSFVCNTNRSIMGFDPVTDMMNVGLYVNELQVQAFDFTQSSGKFDQGALCAEDQPNTGNKVVPIAVGAALAGLVIVVLIAYLIGRLRNRKKSSYEALS